MKRERLRAAQRTQDLRERLLASLLRVIAVVAVLAFVPSAYLSVVQRVWVVLALDSFAFAYCIFLAFKRNLPYRLKVYSIVWLTYVLGVVLVIFTGPFGAGLLFIFAFVFLVSLFGNVRHMVLANILVVATTAGFAVATGFHLLPWFQGVGSVVVISVNFILVSVILSFSANYLIRGYSATAAEERRLREALEMMLREIEHRVKNNLQVIASLVSFRSGKTDDPSRALDDIKESLSAISIVHQLLYRRSAFYLVELNELLSSLVRRFQTLNRGVEIAYDWIGPEAEIDGDEAVSLGVMVNEIVMNSVKHAFEGRSGGKIFVRVEFEAARRILLLVIGDNGCGMAPDGAGSGDGLKIIQALARQLKAETSVESSSGVVYHFTMHLEEPEARLGDRHPPRRNPAQSSS